MSGSDRDALPDVRQLLRGPPNFREWSGDFPGCPVVVSWLSRMFGSGRESLSYVLGALLDVQEWSVGLPGCPGVVGGHPGCPGVVWMPSQMSGICQENLPNVPEWWETLLHVRQLSGGTLEIREALSDVREWSGDHPGCSEVVGRHSRSLKVPPECLGVAGGPSGCPAVLGRPSWMSGSHSWLSGCGWESLTNVRKGLRGYPECPGVVRRPSRKSRSGRLALPDVWEWSGHPPGCP